MTLCVSQRTAAIFMGKCASMALLDAVVERRKALIIPGLG
jgi:hypothetical protein